jgi:predicted metal-dependent phosphoesterase TrpH
LIDLHSHTTESDGTFTPAELIEAAVAARLEALAITDHDTFRGYEEAQPIAEQAGLDLVCGIELSTKIGGAKRKTVHLLAYFLNGGPSAAFTGWLRRMQEARRDRNRRLSEKLRTFGMEVTLEEVDARGRNMAGRPHFAAIMVEKGYVPDYRAAFDLYLDESAPGYVDRDEPSLEEAVERVRSGGGLSSLAHPVRIGQPDSESEERLISRLAACGLDAIEAFHSDHTAEDTERYLAMAPKYRLKITGGSDFHGANKPDVRLGSGDGTLAIPRSVLDALSR